MKIFSSKWSSILSLSYLGIVFLVGVVGVCFYTIGGTFGVYGGTIAGLFIFLVTLPWSVMFVSLLDSFGYIMWYSQFAQYGNQAAVGFFSILGLVPPALLNATLLYFVGKSFDSTTYKKLPKQK